MSAPTQHHCPVCKKKGDFRCITVHRHMIECPLHPGSYHGAWYHCVKCAEHERRAERARQSEDACKKEETQEKDESHKKIKTKARHEQTMKEQREQEKMDRRASTSSGSS